MGIPIVYSSLDDYLDMERSYTIKQTTSPTTGETIASTVVNGHKFEARHANPQRATRKLTEVVEDAEKAGLTLDPPPEKA